MVEKACKFLQKKCKELDREMVSSRNRNPAIANQAQSMLREPKTLSQDIENGYQAS